MPETTKLNTTPQANKRKPSDDPAVAQQKRNWTPFELDLYNAYRAQIGASAPINPNTGRGYGYSEAQKSADLNRFRQMVPLEHEDHATWMARIQKDYPDFAASIAQSPQFNESRFVHDSGFDPEKRRAYQNRAMMDEFTKEMMGPLDLNDPETKRILDNVQSRIRSGNRASGIGGGMASSAETRGVADAVFGETARRKELGMRAYGMVNPSANQVSALNAESDNRKALVQYQNDLSDFEQRRSNMQLGMGIAGGVVGAVAGGYASGGMGAVSGAGAGIAAGAALGGLAAGGPPTQRPRTNGGMTGSGY